MIIGVPKEIKDHEYRVSLTPDGASALSKAGHRVWVEPSAGAGSGGHLAGELYNLAVKVKAQHIPYKGSAPSLIDSMRRMSRRTDE